MTEQIHAVGDVDVHGSEKIRIVHISDTHMRHNNYLPRIPAGDILIHSGDFSSFSIGRYLGNKPRDRDQVIAELDSFFEKLPFKHKVFVAGNHEMSFTNSNKDHVESHLHHVTYLKDSSVVIEGITIYGSPWNTRRWTSYARGFAKSENQLSRKWDKIPSETDILVTHLPPEGVMDLASKKFGFLSVFSSNRPCSICGNEHPDHEHWGSRDLKETVFQRVRPVVHMFGHVHECSGVEVVDGITFSNAAMKLNETINVFDYYYSKKT